MFKVLHDIKQEDPIVIHESIPEDTPIFVKKDGKLIGMVIKEHGTDMWTVRTGGSTVLNGLSVERASIIKAGIAAGYEFYIEE